MQYLCGKFVLFCWESLIKETVWLYSHYQLNISISWFADHQLTCVAQRIRRRIISKQIRTNGFSQLRLLPLISAGPLFNPYVQSGSHTYLPFLSYIFDSNTYKQMFAFVFLPFLTSFSHRGFKFLVFIYFLVWVFCNRQSVGWQFEDNTQFAPFSFSCWWWRIGFHYLCQFCLRSTLSQSKKSKSQIDPL